MLGRPSSNLGGLESPFFRPYDWCDRDGPMTADAAFTHPGDLGTHPGDLRRYDVGRTKSIAVVGGGIAGLTAAYELALLGHNVTVLEATDRAGGRIFTERFGNQSGPYAELGAMRIPYGHRCVDHYVDRFRLATRQFVSENSNAYFLFRGQRVRRRDWPQAAALFGSARNLGPIVGDLGSSVGRPPDAVLATLTYAGVTARPIVHPSISEAPCGASPA